MAIRTVIVDRDETLNVDGGYASDIELRHFAEGAIEGLKLFRDAEFVIAVATNQLTLLPGSNR